MLWSAVTGRRRRRGRSGAGLVASLVLVGACSSAAEDTSSSGSDEPSRAELVDGSRDDLERTVEFVTRTWPTDWSNTIVALDELVLGVGATEPRDAIPPIDSPVYESPHEAAEWLEDREPGALVQLNGDVRFFPLSIMTRHEIVNDEIGGVPLAVTFCPLCNSAIAFDRRVDGRTLRFGVSGLLRNSDLVMWDDETVSLWQQLTGEALVGAHAGKRLELVSTAIVSFGDFRTSFPDARSLSRDTGFDLAYGTNPYEGYSGRFAPLIPVEGERDNRFLPMERVVGVSLDGVDKAYPFSVLSENRAVNDAVGNTEVVVFWGSPDTADALNADVIAESRAIGTAIAFDPVLDGRPLTFTAVGETFVDAETGSVWTILGRAIEGPLAGTQLATVPHRNDFWFAWTAFFPEAAVYAPS